MSRVDEQLTEQFYRWELRGRGWQLFEEPVVLEPPFRPFQGHFLPRQQRLDDGRRHTAGSRFLERLRQSVAPPQPEEEPPQLEDEPEPVWRAPDELVELQMSLPLSRSVPRQQVESFLRHACRPGETLALEILGTERETVPQFVASLRTAMRVERALDASFPGLVVTHAAEALWQAWADSEGCFVVTELGLGSEFMLPLGNPRSDLLSAVVTAMDGFRKEELALFQVLIESVTNSWSESITRAVTDAEGGPFFANRPELVLAAKEKISSPLFAVVIRLVSVAADMGRAWEIVADMAAPLSAVARQGSNYFIPLHNDGYSPPAHEEDILTRQSRRSGMLLNLEELTLFLTLPTTAVSARLRRETSKTRPAPETVTREGTIVLGANVHAGTVNEVRLSPEQRTRHCHILGASGTGKSTLLFNLIKQDIENGQGVAVLDPHGDLVDRILSIIPKERIGDVVLIDPSDEEYSVGFNILAAHSDLEKSLLASDLVGVFQRLSTSWGDQMNSVLRNAILAFLESSEGGTLADLRRFLLDPAFRNRFLATVTDPEIVYYWRQAFPHLSGNKSIGPVVTRLDEFLSRKPIRYMVSQKENRVDFSEVIDCGKIFLAKLPQGLIGRENSCLLGSLLLSKLQQMAMSRQRMRESERRDFWCYVDEFHCFITPSMAEILTGARKYRVGLTLAHQELRQLQSSDEVASAVLANALTRVVFRVGDADARALENGFAHFEARDLQNLEMGEAVCRIERSDFDFNLAIPLPDPSGENEDERREHVIAISRATYARSRKDIEAELLRKLQDEEAKETLHKIANPSPSSSPKPTAPPAASLVPPVSETSHHPGLPNGSEEELAAVTDAVVAPMPVEQSGAAESALASESPSLAQVARPSGQGRGGEDHQLIVANLGSEASRLGFRALKECVVPSGRIDLVIEKARLRIAIEVAVNSNTAHEIENLQKCAESKADFIISVSPHENVRDCISKVAARTFDSETLARIRFESPEAFILWLRGVAEKNPEIVLPGTQQSRIIAGRKVRTRHVEMSPEERRKKEAEEIEVIAELLRNQSSKK